MLADRYPSITEIESARNSSLQFPNLELCIDSGIRTLTDYSNWKKMRLGRAIVGTENHPEPDLLRILDQENLMLSLDFRADQFVGPIGLDQQPEIWPNDVIVMTLARVGSNLGPDLKRLTMIKNAAPNKNIFAAGGISSVSDLKKLGNLGVAGVMLATALHEGRIKRNDIERFS